MPRRARPSAVAPQAQPASAAARAAALAAFLAGAAGAGSALAQNAGAPGWFVTSLGARIEAPAVEGLDCARMRAVLDAIDATGYRREAPKPPHEADMALFDYENRLSAAYWADCVRPSAEDSAPAAAFAGGYEPDPR